MGKIQLFKTLLIVQAVGLMVYTYLAYLQEGANLFKAFMGNMAALNWSGQFNLDFLCYLLLSGLWIMWRNKFNGKGILFAIGAMILGILFFAPYLLWLIQQENANLKRVFIGDR